MKTIIRVALTILALLTSSTPAAAAAERPNVVIILADDLGWADLGCYGNRFNETPNIDELAQQGMRFTQFYAGPVCSPTRANLQSGQHEARFGITQHIPGHRRPFAKLIDPIVPPHLPLEVETIAERLGAAGYVTGYFGKWHLGKQGFEPERQGWQDVLVTQGNTAISSHNEPRRTADFLTEKAVDFIERNRQKPFLLQISHQAVHIPLTTTPELLTKYEQKPPVPGYPCRPEYAGLLEELDLSVGRIVATIDRLRLAERTLILLVSDNGGLKHEQSGRTVTSNKPLRGEKGTLYEGGIRVPAIVRWHGRITAGAECETPATTIDVYPTLVDLAATTPPEGQPLDGVSLLPLLSDVAATLERDGLYWHLPHYHHSTPASAIRYGDWKLIQFFETGNAELYNLSADPGEKNDVADREPKRVEQLRSQLAAWRENVGARMPRSNPDFDPARAAELDKGNRRRPQR